jgi:hypothetical protein
LAVIVGPLTIVNVAAALVTLPALFETRTEYAAASLAWAEAIE